jgi:nucleoside phosphorylase
VSDFDLGIIVALPAEHEAAMSIGELWEDVHYPGSIDYRKGFVEGYRTVLVRCFQQGSVYSALAASDLLRDFSPRLLVLLGIAAGYPGEVSRGDVVIGTPVCCYEYVKVEDKFIQHEPRIFNSTDYFVNIARRLEQTPYTISRSAPQATDKRVKVGPLATGSKVVASQLFRGEIRKVNRKILALEMEAEGIAASASHAYPPRPFLVIKGISDYADRKSKGNKKRSGSAEVLHNEWQEYAAFASAHVLQSFLQLTKSTTEFPAANASEKVQPAIMQWPAARANELEFIQLESHQAALKIGNFSLRSKLFPESLWNEDRKKNLYRDYSEAEEQVVLSWVDNPLPVGLLQQVEEEGRQRLSASQPSDSKLSAGEQKMLTNFVEGLNSSPYPRIVAPPCKCFLEQSGVKRTFLQVPVADSYYGFTLIREGKIDLPTANRIRSTHQLNSLAVRLALTFHKDGQQWVEFQQRSAANFTYKDAWDVTAAGYIDKIKHRDPDDRQRISPWIACREEVHEEAALSRAELPYREDYYFFGIGMNEPTGQLDVLGTCESNTPPNPDRPISSDKVRAYDRCILEPFEIARFLETKAYWVPTAVLTLILTLQAHGFEKQTIENAFSKLEGKLFLEPFRSSDPIREPRAS